MPKTNSQVRTMERDIALAKERSYNESKNKKEEKTEEKVGVFDDKDIKQIEKYKKTAIRDKEIFKERLTDIEEKLSLLESKIRKHEKKEDQMDPRPFRERRRKLLKARKSLEKDKIKAEEKLKRAIDHIQKFKKIEKKIKSLLS